MQLITPPVNPQEFGIEESKANELLGNLPQIKSERAELEKQFDEVIKMDIESPATSKIAKELRTLIKNNRTKGIEVWHKTNKEVFLRGGQFVDAVKRKEVAVNERMEEALETIEKHFETKERERKESLRIERTSKLQSYSEFAPMSVDYAEISEEEFEKILSGAKMQFEAKQEQLRKEEEARKEAERIAEEERIAKEKSEAEERERVRIENEKLKAEAEKREKEIEAERIANEKKLAEERAKVEAERKRVEEEERKKREEIEAKLKAEAEAKAKLEAELKAKKDAEEKAEKERLAEVERQKKEAEKLAKAPIKKQYSVWIDSFELPPFSTETELANDIFKKFDAFKKWAKEQIETI